MQGPQMWSGHVWRGPLKKCKQNILRVRGPHLPCSAPHRIRLYTDLSLWMSCTPPPLTVFTMCYCCCCCQQQRLEAAAHTHCENFRFFYCFCCTLQWQEQTGAEAEEIVYNLWYHFLSLYANWTAHYSGMGGKQIQLPVALTTTFAFCLRCMMLIWLI